MHRHCQYRFTFSVMIQKAKLLVLMSCLALSVFMESAVTLRGLASSSASAPFTLSGERRRNDRRPYRSPLEEFDLLSSNANSTRNLPGPLGVIEQYKAWHSHEALSGDAHDDRRYMVAYYQCPISAGNWLHYFTSAFYWAVYVLQGREIEKSQL